MNLKFSEGATAFQVRYVATRTRTPTPVMDAVSQFSKATTAYTVFTEAGTPCAVLGVKRKARWTHVWLLTTKYTDKFPVAVVKTGRAIIEEISEQYGPLYAVPGDDPRVIALCKALRFKQLDSVNYVKE